MATKDIVDDAVTQIQKIEATLNQGTNPMATISEIFPVGLTFESQKLMAEGMSDYAKMSFDNFYSESVLPHINFLVGVIKPKLQLIREIDKQINYHRLKGYYDNAETLKHSLNALMKESEDQLATYFKEHRDISDKFVSQFVKKIL